MSKNMPKTTARVEMTADIVASYVSANGVAPEKIPDLIRSVYGALQAVGADKPSPTPAEPAVPIKKSITSDYIVCLEDGKRFRSLKRHLRTKFNLTPDEYRARWGLPADYPMVAPSYAEARSKLAIDMGLGVRRKKGKSARTAAEAGGEASARVAEPRTKPAKAARSPKSTKA
ncbi:MAG: MucR family transcriptional regulator [Alphaproteobacteria bacterium]|nr:MucR family transcriptional regulator [Alphaproteobacteria bacterium]